ncbi:MAG: peptidylprolyl isomerase [Elusimicrobiaceae bacterium]|nr:peptidylprolyl isomerase [Elusimicrobiaceae bacterium]
MKLGLIAAAAALIAICGCGDPAATDGKIVSISYALKVNGRQVDTASGDRPFVFTMGDKSTIPGMEEALKNKHKGDKIHILIPPEKAYGAHNGAYVKEVPLSALKGLQVKAGDNIAARTADGKALPAKIIALGKTAATVDFNHPLAGQTLEFDLTVLDVRNSRR